MRTPINNNSERGIAMIKDIGVEVFFARESAEKYHIRIKQEDGKKAVRNLIIILPGSSEKEQ